MRKSVAISIAMMLSLTVNNCAQAASGYYGSKLCTEEGYKCYKTRRGDTWNKLFPDEKHRDLVRRINRMNVSLPHGVNIAVPDDINADPMKYSPFPANSEATGTRYIEVSLSKLAFGAYDESGVLQYWGPISSARGYCPDLHHGCHTPTGVFAVYGKGGAGCVSSKFPIGRGGAPMPYCMYFHGGFALHGSYDVAGYNASHGCIRMYIEDAKWLNRTFTAGFSHVPVIIKQ